MSIVVSVSLATICFASQCFPALVGDSTPKGVYNLTHARVEAPGYGGDVLAFKDVYSKSPFAIHRVWTRISTERRLERLNGPASGRKSVTNGCVNVSPEVYEKLVKDFSKSTLQVVD